MKKALQIIGLILSIVMLVGAGYGIYKYFTKNQGTKTQIVTIDKTNETLQTDVIDKGQDVDVEVNPSLTDKDNLADLTTYTLTANTSGYTYFEGFPDYYECQSWAASLSQDHFFKFNIAAPGTYAIGKFPKKTTDILGSIQVSTYVNKYDLSGNYISSEPIKITYGLKLEEDNIYLTWAEAHFGIQKVKLPSNVKLNNGATTTYMPLQLCSNIAQVDSLFTSEGFVTANVIYKAADKSKNTIETTRYNFSKEAYICFKALYKVCVENGIKAESSEAYNVDLSKHGLKVNTDTTFDYLSANATLNYQTTISGYQGEADKIASTVNYTVPKFKLSY